MTTLVSPGIDVEILNESYYASAGNGTVPLFVFATAANKLDPSGLTVASGTVPANAGVLQQPTSNRDLSLLYGTPNFLSVGGTPVHGDELNEYGLHATASYLGIANTAFTLRADIDLAALASRATAPSAPAAEGTYWLDLSATNVGVFQSIGSPLPGNTWAHQEVLFPTSSQVTSSVPNADFGNVGDFAMVTSTNSNLVYEKLTGGWKAIGSNLWKAGHPTIVSGSAAATAASTGQTFIVNGVTYTVGSNDTSVALQIAAFNAAHTTASDGISMSLRSNGTVRITNGTGGDLVTSGTGLGAYHMIASTYKGVKITYTNDAQYPPSGSIDDVWVKLSKPNNGANFVLRYFTGGAWNVVPCPVYVFDSNNTDDTDPQKDHNATRGFGSSLTTGSVYMAYDAISTAGSNTMIPPTAGQTLIINGTTITFSSPAPEDNATAIAQIQAALVTADIDDLVHVSITKASRLRIAYYGTDGKMTISGTACTNLGIGIGTYYPVTILNLRRYNGTYWENLDYTASLGEPTSDPLDGTLWFNDHLRVDVMEGNGRTWKPYMAAHGATDPGGVIISGSMPRTQSDGTALVNYDLWLDSSDLENYPRLYRYSTDVNKWVLIDNTDQSTPFGVVFADARADSGVAPDDSSYAGFSEDITDMLLSTNLDPDAPDPTAYPDGMLLFNTRYSTNNVKQWKSEWFKDGNFDPDTDYTVSSYSFGATTYDPVTDAGRWVTTSGNREDGSPYMGRKAQRALIVRSLASAITSNEQIRAENISFNLICAPGYPELIDEMVSLNTDCKQTAFIVGDTPCRLAPQGIAITNWATNAANAAGNGEDALTSADEYTAVYYPWGLSTNTDGTSIMVPPSTLAMRTIAFNDQVAYPWFAPAGFTRGMVTNASSVGYLTSEGEYQPISLNQGQRDVLYENNINPIAYFPGRGLAIFGQKTLAPLSSALDRINVARLVNYLKSNLDKIVKPFLFEPNDAQTRNAAGQTVERFLVGLVGLRALEDFAVLCDETNNTPERRDRNELWIDIAIKPVKAIEFIYIPVRIRADADSLTFS